MAFCPSPKDYRDFAMKCLQASEMARDAQTRQIMIDMAKLWMQTASESEQSFALVDNDILVGPRRQSH